MFEIGGRSNLVPKLFVTPLGVVYSSSEQQHERLLDLIKVSSYGAGRPSLMASKSEIRLYVLTLGWTHLISLILITMI